MTLAGPDGRMTPAIVEGVHSAGGRGALPWIEILRYVPKVEQDGSVLDLRERGLETDLFRLMGEVLPPGGHIMVGCEGAGHEGTYRVLVKGVPPAATPLGASLFDAGFRKVKFFYLAEGGWEGQQKLWAEKPIDETMRCEWDRTTAGELKRFLSEPLLSEAGEERPELEECVALAAERLAELEASMEGSGAEE